MVRLNADQDTLLQRMQRAIDAAVDRTQGARNALKFAGEHHSDDKSALLKAILELLDTYVHVDDRAIDRATICNAAVETALLNSDTSALLGAYIRCGMFCMPHKATARLSEQLLDKAVALAQEIQSTQVGYVLYLLDCLCSLHELTEKGIEVNRHRLQLERGGRINFEARLRLATYDLQRFVEASGLASSARYWKPGGLIQLPKMWEIRTLLAPATHHSKACGDAIWEDSIELMGDTYLYENKYKLALQEYLKIRQRSKPQFLRKLADAHYGAGEVEQAMAIYRSICIEHTAAK